MAGAQLGVVIDDHGNRIVRSERSLKRILKGSPQICNFLSCVNYKTKLWWSGGKKKSLFRLSYFLIKLDG